MSKEKTIEIPLSLAIKIHNDPEFSRALEKIAPIYFTDGWFVDKEVANWIVYVVKCVPQYGITSDLEWTTTSIDVDDFNGYEVHATTADIVQRFHNCAIEMGYVHGATIKSLLNTEKISLDFGNGIIDKIDHIEHCWFIRASNEFYLGHCLIFKNGIWAEIVRQGVNTENSLLEDIIQYRSTLPKMVHTELDEIIKRHQK